MKEKSQMEDVKMKIAVSDFDGTLKGFDEMIPKKNIEAIQKWRAAGNKFGLATGRNLKLLEIDIKNYDITFDFIICVNGGVIADEKKEIIHSVKIPSEVRRNFLKTVKEIKNPMIVFCEKTAYSIRPYPEMPIELIPEITFEEVIKRDDVVQFGIKFENAEEAAKSKEKLEREFSMLGGNQNRQFLDINMRGVNKKYGVEKLLEIKKWENCPIYVIGDDANDLPMISRFNGYTVKNSAQFMHKEAKKIYESVGEMLLENI